MQASRSSAWIVVHLTSIRYDQAKRTTQAAVVPTHTILDATVAATHDASTSSGRPRSACAAVAFDLFRFCRLVQVEVKQKPCWWWIKIM